MAKKQKSKRTQRAKKGKQVTKKQELPSLDIWERQTVILRHSICLLLLVVISFSFFAPMHFQGKTLFAYDTVSFKAMANEMLKYEEETGEQALWSPNAFAGMPGYMIYSPLEVKQVDDIPRALRNVIWPSSHMIVLFFGMYFLTYYLVKDNWASLLASVAYGLTTYIPVILVAGHNSKFVTMAFAPWLILAFVHGLRSPGLKSSLLFSIALAVNLRAGHIQITYYVAFLLGIWWLVELYSAFRNGNARKIGMSTLWLGVGSVIGILMFAHPFLANYEYKEYSIRGAAPGSTSSGLSWAYAMRWSQGIGELLTLLISDAYGGASAYWGLKPGTGGPHYIGGIVIVLAGLAAFVVRRRVVYALSISTVLMVLFSLGENFELLNRFMYNYFPLFSSFRVPETWLSIVALILALMAAFGYKHAIQFLKNSHHAFPTSLRAFTIGISFVLLLFVFRGALFDFERPGEVQLYAQQLTQGSDVPPTHPQVIARVQQFLDPIKEERSNRFNGDAIRTLLFLLAAGGVLFFFKRVSTFPAWLVGLLVVAFVTIDLYGVGKRYFNDDVVGQEDSADELVAEYPSDTFLINKKNELGGNGHFRVLSLEGDPQTTARPSYHYESLGGYHGAKLRLYQDYLEHILFDAGSRINENALDMMNTKYIVAGGVYPGTREVFRDAESGLVVSERMDAPDRAFFVGSTETVDNPEAMWSRLKDPMFDVASSALVTSEFDGSTVPIDSTSEVSVVMNSHSPKEISWYVKTDQERLLVVSEMYYPAGWAATLNGTEVPIHRVNYLLRGVSIPAGEHELIMSFDPQSYKLGYWITLVSTLFVYLTLAGMFVLSFMRKKDEKPAVPAE